MDNKNTNDDKSYSLLPSEFISILLIVGLIGLFFVDKISEVNNSKNIPSFSMSPGLSEMLEDNSSAPSEQTNGFFEYRKPHSKEHQKFLVTMYDAILDYNDNVGDNWSVAAYVNEEVIDPDGVILYAQEGDWVSIDAECTEWDDVIDMGINSTGVTIEKIDFKEGFLIDIPVTVTENGGRYIGSTAKWTITLNFEPIK